MKIIEQLPLLQYTNLKSYIDKRNIILFTSPSAYKISQPYIKGLNNITKVFIIDTSKEKDVNQNIKQLILIRKNNQICYAIGGGMTCDVAKYYAYKLKLPLIIIPTIISTDAFLVGCTGLRKDGCVKYFTSKLPEKVILDINLLKKTPFKYHLSGCGDVLSIYTGLYDWKYASHKNKLVDNEKYQPMIACIANSILESLLSEKNTIKAGSKEAIQIIINALIMEVALCNLYGNSRSEEGGEHYFTYCIENKIDHFLHGEMICFAILITSYIQNQDWRKMLRFMDEIGINYVPKGLSEQAVIDTLEELPQYIKVHNLRYGIYNNLILSKNEKRIRKFVRNILRS